MALWYQDVSNVFDAADTFWWRFDATDGIDEQFLGPTAAGSNQREAMV